jgi:hypothetical protein
MAYLSLIYPSSRDDGADATVLPQAAAAACATAFAARATAFTATATAAALFVVRGRRCVGSGMQHMCDRNRQQADFVANSECAIFRGNWNRSGTDVVSSA